MRQKDQGLLLMLVVVIACVIMAFVDIVSPNYPIKSAGKILLFLVVPLAYRRLNRSVSYRELFILSKQNRKGTIIFAAVVYVFIILAYFSIGTYFDFSNVTVALENNIGVNAKNFIFVALYIAIVNSLLEEFFFRGFAFLTLKKFTTRKFAYVFSAGVFSVYHVAIMTSWFTPGLFILLIVSLFVAGLFFNWLNERAGSIYPSWIVHASANFAINTIGLLLFEII
ncbi:membrane protease YdiL (CAAX protease family) [Natronobacillus azotifigens]|uniref:Type II CAAX endopeptidase family protein n=1 Tax=Natronobacillus azotifigens TaxID=472978 RepID=A0A9J6R8U4_9BACI|nr:type II CAAX endopeptidase family protein [Natronobacillus azotifigens]MCZ0701705.1 type II CAAX endopeptidase family protein [Natronobacillus azotifigens]